MGLGQSGVTVLAELEQLRLRPILRFVNSPHPANVDVSIQLNYLV
jgi:hypothetical protein